MRWGVVLPALILPAAAAAQETVPVFGERFTAPDGRQRIAQFSTWDEDILTPHPALVRRAGYDGQRSALQTGAYPVSARGDEEPVELRVVLEIDSTGAPTGCRIVRPSGQPMFDAHACPHLMRHLRYIPALDWQGQRTGDRLAIRVRYGFIAVPVGPPVVRVVPSAIPRDPAPEPTRPIDAAGIGLMEADVPANVTGVSGGLRVERDGRVSACTLLGATRIDAIDLRVCQRLRDWTFTPAIDRSGQPIAARYSFRAKR